MREGFFGVVRTQFLHGGELWQNISSSGRSPSSWRPRLLLPDEPSMGLVPNPVEEVFTTDEGLKESGTTIFLVEQSAYAALSIADRGYVMKTGRVVLSVAGRALLADEKVKAAYLGL